MRKAISGGAAGDHQQTHDRVAGSTSFYGSSVDVDEFLDRPLVAHVAAIGPAGATVRPVWFLYEDGAFWWLTASSYSRLDEWLQLDPRVAVSVNTCDLVSGRVHAVTVTGQAAVVPFDAERAVRKLTKYLGPDQECWDERFRGTFDDPTARFVTLRPAHPPRLRDLSFQPSASKP